MILTGDEIVRMHGEGRITIDPFDVSAVRPNSVDLRLADELLEYVPAVLDMRRDNLAAAVKIPPEGMVLEPGRLYLGSTAERCGSDEFVTLIEGRSSVARLGIAAHVSAGVGDIGFAGRWTCEITVVRPVRIYAGVRFCQAIFFEAKGERSRLYKGKYTEDVGAATSRMWKDFAEKGNNDGGA